MKHRIVDLAEGSIAHQLGIRAGDLLVSIGGEEIRDWIDYQAFSATEKVQLVVERDGESVEYAFEKDEYEHLGLIFEKPLMSRERDCANKCIFCFVDQLPRDVRISLRVKDDDWRLSLMMGNFVTLTNVGDRELQRIIDRRAAPLYISVHATDGEVRSRMLGNNRGGEILMQLRRLSEAGLTFYTQVVLCPGVNDGAVLDQTIRELSELPACAQLAVVPVGLTGHRSDLTPLLPFDKEGAEAVLDQIDGWRKKLMKSRGSFFVHGADEFYLLSGRPIPEDEAYEGYPLLENGVGMIRLFYTEYEDAWRDADFSKRLPRKVVALTGRSFAGPLRALVEKFPVPGISVEVIEVENRFFGPSVTVAGLLTGGDLRRVKERLSGFDRVLIPSTMLRTGEDVFLDGLRPDELGFSVTVVGPGGENFLYGLMED